MDKELENFFDIKFEELKNYIGRKIEVFQSLIEAPEAKMNSISQLPEDMDDLGDSDVRKIRVMNFAEIESLTSFYDTITEIAEENNFKVYNKISSAISSERYGRYFFRDNGEDDVIYIWFGLWIGGKNDNCDNGIWINFEKSSDESWLSKKYKQKLGELQPNKMFCEKCEPEKDGSCRFKLINKQFTETFCSAAKTVEEQKELLSNFFNEVVGQVVKD